MRIRRQPAISVAGLGFWVWCGAVVCVLVLMTTGSGFAVVPAADDAAGRFMSSIQALSVSGDRRTGTTGNQAAGAHIRQQFEALGLDSVGSHRYRLPVLRHNASFLTLIDRDRQVPIQALMANAISPGTISEDGLEGPLIYVGRGEMSQFNQKAVTDAIILMELDSGKNWLQAANLGARALIYVDRGDLPRTFLDEKMELSPLDFPRFWMSYDRVRELWGDFQHAPQGRVDPAIRLTADIRWTEAEGANIYGLIPGDDPDLSQEVVLVEAFYDSSGMVAGNSPGADEACSAATLLDLARHLKRNPPGRSVLLVATGGHAQTLGGMRELIWSLHTRSTILRKMKRGLKSVINRNRDILAILASTRAGSGSTTDNPDDASRQLFADALGEQIKTESDRISRHLMQLRLQRQTDEHQEEIQDLARQRLVLRRLGWRRGYADLDPDEAGALERLIPRAEAHHAAVLADAEQQQTFLDSARRFRSLVKEMELSAVVSLHLSSHGDGFGAFNQGWLYPLKPQINRVSAYSLLDNVLHQGAEETSQRLQQASLYRDTLRPSRRRSWQSYFIDRPALGGEVSALAGYLGISLATVNDARARWGTPNDRPEEVDARRGAEQSAQVCGLIRFLTLAPQLHEDVLPRDGFATISGRVNFLRHGELFADQAAPGAMILGYQGPGRYYAMVDTLGKFQLRGVADKKHLLHKVIIEGYRFDPASGDVVWAIDKPRTGKPAYRLKMQRKYMETDLVMFACRQTTLFNLLEPRSFRYMTKLQLIDGRREAPPLKYWYSRIDTRKSIITSTYLEPGTRLKMTLSDSVLSKKLILTHATPGHPQGTGYLVDDWPTIPMTELHVARDMWQLLGPRIANLERHGIYKETIRNLQNEGLAALKRAEQAQVTQTFDQYAEAAARSWALASRVYDDVEKTQKDILFGVLFYIALFVPFAFCLERLLFGYANIYKRIVAFCTILLAVIGVIYSVHPAFQLAYSPMVVIIAFFIMGLSLIVTLIIFFRFEDEMSQLQSRAASVSSSELSRWKAFVASFLLGVSNLRRRRIRTALTCTTLIILTFTIMSFTAVKSMRHHARLFYRSDVPYEGLLLKNVNWRNLPSETLGAIANAFGGMDGVAPRVWLEGEDRTRSLPVPVTAGERSFEARGLVGLSAAEPSVTALDRCLVGGRWFRRDEKQVLVIPDRMAHNLGIDPNRPDEAVVRLWGMPFKVVGVFAAQRFGHYLDLDGEPLTPVTFPGEAAMAVTEVEMEAMESGEDVRSFQSRYQHVAPDLTVIMPHDTLLAAGGHLKALAVRLPEGSDLRTTARHAVDRFGLSLFSGEPGGTFLYHAADTMRYSGVPNIVIPLIISVFIVLNTMIGSVYERKREIGIYTSVGLAPSHVSFLFIAEALAFAVLSVVLGYLLAQASASLFADTALWAGITVNYSSLAGVAAMLLVILVVLVSVIYPSRVAAQIAIPDVNRSWSLPAARSNTLDLTLPFLMQHGEQDSAGGYLFAHLQGHQDVSHGIFSAGGVSADFVAPTLAGNGGAPADAPADRPLLPECLLIQAQVWLAPFDFGIMQQVAIQFCPSNEAPGYLEIRIRLIRESGEANAWRRINKVFLHAIRKQLLIWRSIADGAKDQYRAQLQAAVHGEDR